MLLVDMDPTAAAVEFISPAWSTAVAPALRSAKRGGYRCMKYNRAAVAATPIIFDLINAHIVAADHFCVAATAALFFYPFL